MVVGDMQASWFAAAGLIICGGLIFSGRLDREQFRNGFGASVLAAALGFAAVYVSLSAIALTFHRLALTPERTAAALIAALLMLPFWIGF
jgi:hypothetical protein